jgi:hypothetical protein
MFWPWALLRYQGCLSGGGRQALRLQACHCGGLASEDLFTCIETARVVEQFLNSNTMRNFAYIGFPNTILQSGTCYSSRLGA